MPGLERPFPPTLPATVQSVRDGQGEVRARVREQRRGARPQGLGWAPALLCLLVTSYTLSMHLQHDDMN